MKRDVKNGWKAEGKTEELRTFGNMEHMPPVGALIVNTALGIEGSGVVELFVLDDTEEAGEKPFAFEKAWLVPLLARLRVAVRSTIPYETGRRVFGSLTAHSGY